MEQTTGTFGEVLRESQPADRSLMHHEAKSQVRVHVEHGWELVEQGQHRAEVAPAPCQVRARQECDQSKQYRRDTGAGACAEQGHYPEGGRLSKPASAFARYDAD